MAFLVKDRVQETCAAPGTGTVTLLGAATGYQSFSAAIGANNTTFYAIADQGGANWEVGLGTIGSGGTTLARTTILASSNGGSATNFSSGVQNIWCDYPAGKAILLDPNGDISTPIIDISAISGAITAPESITFDTTPSVVPTATGSMYWDSADSAQTLSLVMEGGNAVQQIGEEAYFRIKCSSAITEGQVVMFTGTVGSSGGLTGAPATGLTAATASYVMGVATESGALNDWIYVTSFGLVRGINTTGGAESWIDGQILYYDPTVTGGLTKNLPSAPNAKVQVCAVVHAASNGSLFIRPSFGGELGQYEGNVQITSAVNKDLLQYNGTYWANQTIPAAFGTQTANTVWAGPTTGAAANPSFRALVAADIPSTYSEFAAGTALLFNQTAAPTGWTKITTNDNAALRVVSGTVGSGGSVNFTTAFASQTPAGSVSTSISAISGSVGVSGSVGNTTLAESQMPSHRHVSANYQSLAGWSGNSPGNYLSENLNYGNIGQAFTGYTGGNGAHNHGFSGSGSFTFSSGTASSSFSGTAINLAVKYVDVIVATKN